MSTKITIKWTVIWLRLLDRKQIEFFESLVIIFSHVENICACAVCWHFRKTLVGGVDKEDCREEGPIMEGLGYFLDY